MNIAILSLKGPSSLMIEEACRSQFSKVSHYDLRDIQVFASSKGVDVRCNSSPLRDYDAVYIRGSYRFWMLKRSISRVLGPYSYLPMKATAFTLGHNKFLTLLELQKNNIGIPRSHFVSTAASAKEILDEVAYPIIIKTPYSTHGRGVVYAENASSARSMVDALEENKQPYIIQEFVEANASDIRAIVCGDTVVAAMKRTAGKNEIRANMHAGATGKPVKLTNEQEEVAIRSAKALGADICGVDILATERPLVLEVNLSPGIVYLSHVLGKPVANDIASFLAEQVREHNKKGQNMEINRTLEKPGTYHLCLNMPHGAIKLPEFVSKISKLSPDQDVTITVEKGRVEIREGLHKDDVG